MIVSKPQTVYLLSMAKNEKVLLHLYCYKLRQG